MKALERMSEGFQKMLDYFRLKKRDYQWTFNTPHGDRVLRDLAAYAGIGMTPWAKDDAERNFRLGQQDMVYRIGMFLDMQPERIIAVLNDPNRLHPNNFSTEERTR